jgi:aldose sugar dehydrogenase
VPLNRRPLRLAGIVLLLVVAAGLIWLAPKIQRRLTMQGLRAVTIAQGLEFPWALAFLPDGRMLVTERAGRMRIVAADGTLGPPIDGLPPVHAQGEGGLLDVALSPRFNADQLVYWSYAEPAADGKPGASTAVARGKLAGNQLADVQVIFRQATKGTDNRHYGSRLLFAPDGSLFIGLGDRHERADAQRLDSAHGKIMHVQADGRASADNPFAAVSGALPEIWSLGHRNVQGMAFHPATGELWATEHGPQGGDELNVIERARNYGWPVITYGTEYTTNAKIGEGTAKPGMEQPLAWWGPQSNAPSGMAFLTSDRYPAWKGQLFIGTLRDRALVRLKLDGHRVVEQQALVTGLLERIRDVRQGPDGWLYVLTDAPNGRILRIEPCNAAIPLLCR